MAKKTYQQMREELDSVVTSLQGSELDIDEATKLYEDGLRLVGELEQNLHTAENKITRVHTEFEQKAENHDKNHD